ncbi:hypothetical protein [Amycolatopsis rubida]|uniref:hypothetical protein n=1 Tax=Amycolatopsis rubida TaxID=112413 RepID=UPI00142F3637|nr:hypothetical protein [Amycolatopsis rubida]
MLHDNFLRRAIAPAARRGREHPQPNQLTPYPRDLTTPNDTVRVNRRHTRSGRLPSAPGALQIHPDTQHRQLPDSDA